MVISDHLLQGKTGTELAAEMKRLKPGITIVIVSGLVEEPEGMEHADLFIGKTPQKNSWVSSGSGNLPSE
jgi:hypothetical protein